MALPVAHSSVALGATKSRDPLVLAFLAVLSVSPDFDFLFVVLFDLPMHEFHRTWSHSIIVALVAALLWARLRPKRLAAISPILFFVVLAFKPWTTRYVMHG
jgi:membrane-bound metal-dependent hydrolase YbcI (DUF457 family)